MKSFVAAVLSLISLNLQIENVSPVIKIKQGNYPAARIVNGNDAKQGQFPFQASVRGFDKEPPMAMYDCGGSLISSLWVLTAAHCVINQLYWIIRIGTLFKTSAMNERGVVEMKTYEAIKHPKFSLCGVDSVDDIALIKLPHRVRYTKNIRPIRLPKISDFPNRLVNVKVRLSGWGATHIYDDIAWHLQYADFVTITNEECKKKFPCVIDSSICAVGRNTSSCLVRNFSIYYDNVGRSCGFGDSGSPYTYREADGRRTQIGIDTLCDEHCTPGAPNGLTRTVYFLDWIHNITKIPLRP